MQPTEWRCRCRGLQCELLLRFQAWRPTRRMRSASRTKHVRTHMQDRQRLPDGFRLLRFQLHRGYMWGQKLHSCFAVCIDLSVHWLSGEISRGVSCCRQYWRQGKRGGELGRWRLANGRNSVATPIRPFQYPLVVVQSKRTVTIYLQV